MSGIWRNTGSGFTSVPIDGLPPFALSSVAWGDFDNDGRLDFLLLGEDYGGNRFSQLWRNITLITNTPPAAPTGLTLSGNANGALLSWISATDAQTPSSGLSYNVCCWATGCSTSASQITRT